MNLSLDPILAITLVFLLLYVLPGWLTARLLRLGTRYSRVQVAALAFGLGFSEALLIGQGLVLLQAPTWTLASGIGMMAIGKLAWLLPRHGRSGSALGLSARLDTALVAQVLLVIFGAALLIVNVRQFPVYTYSPGDSWYYTQVQMQFSKNPGAWNIQPGITAPGTNERLLWSSYLYNRALIVDLAQTDAMITQQRDGQPILYILALIVAAALGRALLGDRQWAWLAGCLQVGLLVSLTGDQNYFTGRLPEDKFFSFFIYLPLVWLPLLRLLRTDQVPVRGDALLFCLLTITALLIHVFNPIALFVTAVPLIAYRWLRQNLLLPRIGIRSAFTQRSILLVIWLGVLLMYPLFMQMVLTARSTFVAEGMSAARQLDLSYRLQYTWGYAQSLPDFVTSLGMLGVVGVAAFVRRDDLAAQFVAVISTTILVLLWVPPFAGLAALVMTTSQNWRIFMLLPLGFGWAWLAAQGWRLLFERIGTVQPVQSALRAAYGVGVVLLLIVVWGWIGRVPDTRPTDTARLPEPTRGFLAQYRDVVGDGMVLTSDSLTIVLASLWWDARLLYFGRGALQPDIYAEVRSVILMEPNADPSATFAHYSVDYVLLGETTPLIMHIREGWDCCTLLAEQDGLVLYQVE